MIEEYCVLEPGDRWSSPECAARSLEIIHLLLAGQRDTARPLIAAMQREYPGRGWDTVLPGEPETLDADLPF